MRIINKLLMPLLLVAASSPKGSIEVIEMNPGLQGAWVLAILISLTAAVFLSIVLIIGIKKPMIMK